MARIAPILVLGITVLLWRSLKAENPHSNLQDEINKISRIVTNPHEPVEARRNAVTELENMSEAIESARPALMQAVGDPDEEVRLRVAIVLYKWTPKEWAVTELTKRLSKEQSPEVRAAIARALGSFWSKVRELEELQGNDVARALAKAAKDKDHNVRLEAVHALGNFGPFADTVVPPLIEALKELDLRKETSENKRSMFRVCLTAANSLRRIGPPAKAATQALLDIVKNGKEENLQILAISALGSIGDVEELVVPALLTATEKAHLRNCAIANPSY